MGLVYKVSKASEASLLRNRFRKCDDETVHGEGCKRFIPGKEIPPRLVDVV